MARFACWKAVQYKALALMAMLAGHEAARIRDLAHQRRARVTSSPVDAKECENKPMCKENGECRFGWGHDFGCTPKDKCAWQWLVGDDVRDPSESCRISDKFMLKDKDTFVEPQLQLLLEQSEEIKKTCTYGVNWNLIATVDNVVNCQRGYRQTLRAIKYITQAQSKNYLASLTPEAKEEQTSKFKSILGSFIDPKILGADAVYVNKLKKKLSKKALQSDPEAAIVLVVGLLKSLLHGNEEEKKKARDEIDEMPDGDGSADSPVESRLVNEVEDKLESVSGEMHALLSEVERSDNLDEVKVEPSNTKETNATATSAASLVESRRDMVSIGKDVKKALFAVLVVLYLIVLLEVAFFTYLSFVLLVLLGCGAGAEIDLKNDQLTTFKTCFVHLVKLPATYSGAAVLYIYRKLWLGKTDAGMSWPDEPDFRDTLTRYIE